MPRPVDLPDHVVVQSFVSETVLMDVATGRYFSLDRVGGAMLEAIIESGEIMQAAETLAAGGWGQPDEVANDLSALCCELAAFGLVHLEAAS